MQGGWSCSPQPAVGGGRCGNRSRYSSEIWYGEWTDWIAKYQNCGRSGCSAAASISCTDFSVYMYEEYRQTFEVVLPSVQVHTPCNRNRNRNRSLRNVLHNRNRSLRNVPGNQVCGGDCCACVLTFDVHVPL